MRALASCAVVVGVAAGFVSPAGGSAIDPKTATINYAGTTDPRQTLDAYYDAARRNQPWVMTIHGGSWVHGDKTHVSMVRARVAFQGIGLAVFNINYRLVGNGIAFAQQMSDVNAAYAYVRSHADEFGIDPDEGVVYGYSAGGHLAAELGLEGDGGTGVRAIVTVSGVLEPHRLLLTGVKPTVGNITLYGWAVLAIGCPYASCPRSWVPFAPQNEISARDPAMLMFQGTADTVVPPSSVDTFERWLTLHHVPGTVVKVAGRGHTDSIVYGSATRTAQMLQFVERRLGCSATTGC
jgi:acetyl esterase/lipase